MRLHENWELFSAALQAASQPLEEGGLGIKSIFIEKDYWICRSLSLMAANDKDNRAIFKGGTSLTKAYSSTNFSLPVFCKNSVRKLCSLHFWNGYGLAKELISTSN